VNVFQIATLDQRQLGDRVGRLPTELLDALDHGLRLALELT
jgi:mRNA-degrading endonuclease toxin of MazEF toxin-antitoxin module